MEQLPLLFEELGRLTGVADIAYHEIIDGHLNPVLKTKTDHLGIEKWKQTHAENPVYIENDRLLQSIIARPHTAVVQDVKNDPRSVDEFFLFGIDSIMILPVVKEAKVEGIVVVASIGQLHHFDKEEIQHAERLVEQYRSAFQILG
ncbi:GAF domain-containing protein [Paenibacillus physcomitrellae]|uniref:GAF domain-containing protein n=1 Tax=Paenibacillus physcomitrellae TaxID=1619311 RepID=A0ABQ1G6E9_9BACL|nr:GAF domain-containing protein [Paenibacillus physcomitrellae]GGA37673.1 hypothetical protein GCM10010917_23560 [Paenibacillus physcomitrellae]